MIIFGKMKGVAFLRRDSRNKIMLRAGWPHWQSLLKDAPFGSLRGGTILVSKPSEHKHWRFNKGSLLNQGKVNSDGRARIWRKQHEATCLESTVQAAVGGEMVWGIFSWKTLA